jgi:hypothetical protein
MGGGLSLKRIATVKSAFAHWRFLGAHHRGVSVHLVFTMKQVAISAYPLTKSRLAIISTGCKKVAAC